MHLTKDQFSELLTELSNEQQETVAGGTSNEVKNSYHVTKKFEYSEKSTDKGEGKTGLYPIWHPFFLSSPLVEMLIL